MADTTQAQLIALANRHTENGAVSAILFSIREAQGQAQQHLHAQALTSASLAKAAQLEEGFWVGLDHADYVATAAKAAAALSRISILLATLASALSSLGEGVSY